VKALPTSILKKSAQCRAKYKNKLPDSIHLATALNERCTVFVTNDVKLKTPDNIETILLREI